MMKPIIIETRFHESIEDTTMIVGLTSNAIPFFAWSTKANAEELVNETEKETCNLEDGQHGWEFHVSEEAAKEAMNDAWEALTGGEA